MNQVNLVRDYGYEISEAEKTPYYWKAKHDRFVAGCRASEGQVRDFMKDLIRWLGKALYGVLWTFTRIVWGVAYIVEKLVDGSIMLAKWAKRKVRR